MKLWINDHGPFTSVKEAYNVVCRNRTGAFVWRFGKVAGI